MRNQYPLKFFLRFCCRHHSQTIGRKISNLSTLISALRLSENPFPSINELRYRRREFAQLLQVPDQHNIYYKSVHSQMVVLGFQSDVFLANILLHSYSKSNSLLNAELIFDKILGRNLITWSSMISMYTHHGQNEEALMIFSEFRKSSSENPNEFILASVLRACTQLGAVDQATQVHDFVIKAGFDQDVYVGTSLIDFYSKNGEIEEARLVFDDLLMKTAVTWTTMITGYSQSGKSEVSLQLFIQMLKTEVLPDRYVLSSAISACSMLEFLEGGKQIHAYVLRNGTETDVSVINVLIDLYSKCHRVKISRQLFDQMVLKNVVSWTTMIAGYMQNSCHWDAVKLFSEMTQLGWQPDGFTCTSILTSCGSAEALELGRQVHSYTIKAKLESDEFVRNSLIDMYAKCNSLDDAKIAFDTMPVHNVISCNAMIEGYARQDKVFEALGLFNDMRLKSFHPSLLTFVSILGVSASLSTMDLSKEIHGLVIKSGISLDIYAGSALVDVYSKCFCVEDARLVFEEMNERDIVVWNAMVFGHTQNGQGEEAFKLFLELQSSGLKPNEFTFVGVITAASNLASLVHGQQFHSQLIKSGQYLDPYVSNALVDMYAKCGSIEEAHKMFHTTCRRDVVCWNSMISTYAHHGLADEALQMFQQMQDEGIEPNYVTFVGLLSACSHGGLVESGLCLFDSMATEFDIKAGTEHYACVVALLGRAGRLHEAKEFIEHMPIEPAAIVWRSFLSACRVAGNVEMGRYAAEMAISIDPKDSGSYVLLSNIYASRGMWADVEKVRKGMDCNGVLKEPGHSWIEIDSNVHVFIARDKTHGQADLIYSVLDRLTLQIKGVGYVPDTATCLLED
ncbi:pentatricopeptide repeat-containing protein At4g39530 [Macadamia integrifolia]|uniref:pentatricopeptide repeat-containing protein At4g39530 n=1 Tax=Macadamia integrifolia TaxID=60698 RepID=UPI001C4FDEF4|nr:pentatricopeptide repeat-containing protein At4g39530 [Macadamia integrifolia]XP_042510774.1 pentatricopeptide repeat-containing protein At4g39530 [Macadamia integrifolia]